MHQGQVSIKIVVPQLERLIIVMQRSGKCSALVIVRCPFRRPVQSPHSIQPLVQKAAHFFEHLHGLLPFLLGAHRLMLVSPRSTLEQIAQPSTKHGGQQEPCGQHN
jgi:hypothetical protein